MDEVLFRKIERLKEEVRYLATHRAKFLAALRASIETKKIVERSVYLCAEMALDIADTIITQRGLPKPVTYADAVRKLGEHKVLPARFALKFGYIAGLRNFLAHDYQIDTSSELQRFLQSGVADMKKFVLYVEKS
jgi:uncharacterized protein YutE (UPF0331/DUF86 family)